MASTYHLVHYKRFVRANANDPAFEVLCRNALDSQSNGVALWQRVNDRVFDLPVTENRKILLNSIADLQSAVFGEFCFIQSDGFQALVELTKNQVKTSKVTTAQIFKLAEASAPQNSQFIRGMGYWLAIKDHLFFVKTQSLTAEHLRLYFDWLLKVQTTVLPSTASVTLQGEFDPSQVGGDIGEIKSLRVTGEAIPLSVKSAADAPNDSARFTKTVRETAKLIMDKSAAFAEAIPIVELIFGKTKAKSLVDSLGDNEYLTVDTSVKVRGKRTEESRTKMRQLATELADMTDAKVQVEGKDGKLSDDDAILRTRMPFDLPHEGSNFLEFDNVSDQLQKVYARFVEDGKIKP
jgi:hypothetical protein